MVVCVDIWCLHIFAKLLINNMTVCLDEAIILYALVSRYPPYQATVRSSNRKNGIMQNPSRASICDYWSEDSSDMTWHTTNDLICAQNNEQSVSAHKPIDFGQPLLSARELGEKWPNKRRSLFIAVSVSHFISCYLSYTGNQPGAGIRAQLNR